jgi:hypothetical protein
MMYRNKHKCLIVRTVKVTNMFMIVHVHVSQVKDVTDLLLIFIS